MKNSKSSSYSSFEVLINRHKINATKKTVIFMQYNLRLSMLKCFIDFIEFFSINTHYMFTKLSASRFICTSDYCMYRYILKISIAMEHNNKMLQAHSSDIINIKQSYNSGLKY